MIIVTRPRDQALQWVQGLSDLGIAAVAVPLLGIHPVAPEDPEREALDAARSALFGARTEPSDDLLVFVSPNAVQQFLGPAGSPPENRLSTSPQPTAAPPLNTRPEHTRPEHTRPERTWPEHTWAAAPGPGTAAALLEAGVPAHRILQPAADSPQFDSASLWKTLQHHDWRGRRVLVVRGLGGREELIDWLRAAGAQVRSVCAYRRGAPELLPAEREHLLSSLRDPASALWLFSSSEALAHLLPLAAQALSDEASAVAWARRVPALATHPRIVEQAHRLGFARTAACRPGLQDVAAALAEYNRQHREP